MSTLLMGSAEQAQGLIRPSYDDLPSAIPIVSMDIRLGERLKPDEVIDFDYNAFYDVAHALSATRKQIDDLDIAILDPKEFRRDVAGRYEELPGYMPFIGINFGNMAQAVMAGKNKKVLRNQALVHELAHYLGVPRTEEEQESYDKYPSTLKKSLGLLAFTLVSLGASCATSEEILKLAPAVPAIVTGAMLRKLHREYSKDSREVHAESVQKEFKNTEIITVRTP